ncbi:hypothetical protein TanjilG_18201 [Lupinus angustifolius]|uniref:DCD domain-containing protein n=2 Tax=Lupinus angustifolius TaxID=3871 RepID=A0A1J7HZ67_LUPAN|nr:PREDICTED: uncharacterized protein LOC109348004 isoform X2 [Lupinus angustifolius]OIW11674.1 hypothetical protein TanjilG_18201 [Lupinus angustifolius]
MESRDLSRRKLVSGQFPQCGAIFMSNRSTLKECFEKRLFGLPVSQSGFVTRVKAGMILFLFEFEKRELYGVFEAISDGGMHIVPQAYVSSGRWFPAQVKITTIWTCDPLLENEFRDAIQDNYYTANKFNFGLSMDQVSSLLWFFSSKKLQIPKSLHHNKRKNIEQGYKYINGELKKRRFTKIDIAERSQGPCAEPEVERNLSSDFCKTSASIPSDSDAYDPDHPGFLHPDDSEAQSASGHGLRERLTMQEKKDNFYISAEDTEDYIPLFSPDHSDIEEEWFDFIECSEEEQVELGAFVGNKVPFIPVPQLPLRPISSNEGHNRTKLENLLASLHGSDSLSSFALPLSSASHLHSENGHKDLRSVLSKGMYAGNAKKRTSVFSRLNFSSTGSSSKTQNDESGKKLMNDISKLKQQGHAECEKMETVTQQKHEVEDCNVDKRTSVFMCLTSASYTVSQEVHCVKSMKKETNAGKKTKKKFNFSEWEYYDKVDRSQEMLAQASDYIMQSDGFEDVSVSGILEKLWQRHVNRREYCGEI